MSEYRTLQVGEVIPEGALAQNKHSYNQGDGRGILGTECAGFIVRQSDGNVYLVPADHPVTWHADHKPEQPAEIRTAARCFRPCGDDEVVWVITEKNELGWTFRMTERVVFRSSYKMSCHLEDVEPEITPAAALTLLPADWQSGRDEMLRLFAKCPVVEEIADEDDIPKSGTMPGNRVGTFTVGPMKVLNQPEPIAANCTWSEDEEGIYETDCGHTFEAMNGDPLSNGAKWCMFCGCQILTVPFDPVEGDMTPEEAEPMEESLRAFNKSVSFVAGKHVAADELDSLKADAAKWRALDLSGVPDGWELVGLRRAEAGEYSLGTDGRPCKWVCRSYGPVVIIRRITPPSPPDTAESLLREAMEFVRDEGLAERIQAVLKAGGGE